MSDDIATLLQRHRGGSAVIDTNLLLLLCVGRFDSRLVTTFKRVRKYELADFDLIHRLATYFSELTVTPNVWTETANLASQLGEPKRSQFFEWFRLVVPRFRESYIRSADAVAEPSFIRLSLTDSGLATLARKSHLVITDDLDLWLTIQNGGGAAVNFSHIRAMNWSTR